MYARICLAAVAVLFSLAGLCPSARGETAANVASEESPRGRSADPGKKNETPAEYFRRQSKIAQAKRQQKSGLAALNVGKVFSSRLRSPSSVLGGKNSKETTGFLAAIFAA